MVRTLSAARLDFAGLWARAEIRGGVSILVGGVWWDVVCDQLCFLPRVRTGTGPGAPVFQDAPLPL